MGDVRTEPSMEEILASIKRIIADDGIGMNGGRPAPRADSPALQEAARAPDAPPEPVLELTEAVAPPVAETPPAVPDATVAPVALPQAPPATASHAPVPGIVPAPPPALVAGAPKLVSEGAACASRQSLSALSSLVVKPASGDNTLDGLVRDMLRPMLTEWLDAHLPAIVETLVSREIARITAQDD